MLYALLFVAFMGAEPTMLGPMKWEQCVTLSEYFSGSVCVRIDGKVT